MIRISVPESALSPVADFRARWHAPGNLDHAGDGQWVREIIEAGGALDSAKQGLYLKAVHARNSRHWDKLTTVTALDEVSFNHFHFDLRAREFEFFRLFQCVRTLLDRLRRQVPGYDLGARVILQPDLLLSATIGPYLIRRDDDEKTIFELFRRDAQCSALVEVPAEGDVVVCLNDMMCKLLDFWSNSIRPPEFLREVLKTGFVMTDRGPISRKVPSNTILFRGAGTRKVRHILYRFVIQSALALQRGCPESCFSFQCRREKDLLYLSFGCVPESGRNAIPGNGFLISGSVPEGGPPLRIYNFMKRYESPHKEMRE